MAGNESPDEKHLMDLGIERQRQAYDFCEAVRHAVELRDGAERLMDLAQRAASTVVRQSTLRNQPFGLEISIPTETQAYVVLDDHVVEEHPGTFIATELGGINNHGVEFIDGKTGRELRISGFNFDLNPSLSEE